MKQPCKTWCPLGQKQDKNHPACKQCNARVLYAKHSALEYLYSADQIEKVLKKIRVAIPDFTPKPPPPVENSKSKRVVISPQIKGFCPRCGRQNNRKTGNCSACRLYIRRHREIGEDGCKECITPGCKQPGNYCRGVCMSCYNRIQYRKRRAA